MWPAWIPKNILVYVAVLTAHFGVFLNGTYIAWTSPVLVKLTSLNDNPLGRVISNSEQGWLVSIGVLGNWMGSCTSGVFAKNYGRKTALIVYTIPSLISYATFCIADTFWLMLVVRLVGGITSGAMFTVDPMYFGEVAEPKNRGLLGGAMNAFLNIGILFVLCVGPSFSFFWLHVILTACPVLYIIMMFLIVPESPYYLIESNEKKAENVLKKLRGEEDVKAELSQIREYVHCKTEDTGTISEIIHNKTTRKALIIGCGLLIFQQCSGVGVIMSFGQLIFEEVGDFLPSDLSAIILGIAQVIFSLMAPPLTDSLGRKIVLIFSHLGMSLSLLLFGVYFLMKEYGAVVHSISWLPLTALVFFKFAYSAGSGQIPFIIIGEIFPQRIKGPASSITSVATSATALILANSYTMLKASIGMGYTFWIFASMGIFATLFIIFFVLETKGKSLQQIQEALQKSKKTDLRSCNL
ncbi:facilitated trehalose transporter Tret1-like [Coccinella septempunctata]|uniref:facilitated trehalose transporter Tret1-like n=1 Tax=Coccinella septempunctata TaxID=41139 RepID=UPI001D087FEE|nr:facilitated trehalose transporter Tret1-like [Coccinella septempunctata]